MLDSKTQAFYPSATIKIEIEFSSLKARVNQAHHVVLYKI